MYKAISSNYFKLLFFSVFICLITYGFALTNFSLSIDSESVIYPNMSLNLGRWGTNLVRYRIFDGIVPYFTLLLSLFLLSFAAAEFTRLLHLNRIMSYVFCGVFLSFPQMAYQLVFTMQSDAIALGFLSAAFTITFFSKFFGESNSVKKVFYFILASLLFMFTIAIYQALAFIPIIIYLIIFFQNTYRENYDFKTELKKGLWFGILTIVSVILYFVSVKIFCHGASSGGFLASYVVGKPDNLVGNFIRLWGTHLAGNAYYGDKTFLFATLIAVIVLIRFFFEDKKALAIRIVLLLLLLLIPFSLSFFITNGYNPPRLYVTSGIVFAFLVVHLFSTMKFGRMQLIVFSLLVLPHIYFITMLFWSHNKLYHHDIGIARKMDEAVRTKYPDFDPTKDYVYFFGHLPYEEDERFRLPDSEIFGGSFFIWDNGSNERIVEFMRFSDVAYYRYIDNLKTYLDIKDSISAMPVYPKDGYIKRVNNVVIIKIGDTKGAPLWVEQNTPGKK